MLPEAFFEEFQVTIPDDLRQRAYDHWPHNKITLLGAPDLPVLCATRRRLDRPANDGRAGMTWADVLLPQWQVVCAVFAVLGILAGLALIRRAIK